MNTVLGIIMTIFSIGMTVFAVIESILMIRDARRELFQLSYNFIDTAPKKVGIVLFPACMIGILSFFVFYAWFLTVCAFLGVFVNMPIWNTTIIPILIH